ncbi:MAG: M48 family metallopeptidase [Comamonadaceae bacterium]|nr:M48 family metallopeptidase [Comamonadaceae bacterium]
MRQLAFDWFASSESLSDEGQKAKPEPPSAPRDRPQPPARGGTAHEPADPLTNVLSRVQFLHPRANREIAFEHALVAYEFRRGKRRTIGFTVSADGLVVSAPRITSIMEVEAALREKERWIVTKLREARERQDRMESTRIEWREGASIPFLGELVFLEIDPRQRHGRGGAVLQADGELAPGTARRTLQLGLPDSATPAQLRDITQAWLMRQARRIFTARLDHFAPQLGVQWQKLTLSSAGTRWGSASADGSIRLNWRLVHFSEPIIDYVVVHELAHLHEMNHGPRFWAHVERVLPDYVARRCELKDEAVPQW